MRYNHWHELTGVDPNAMADKLRDMVSVLEYEQIVVAYRLGKIGKPVKGKDETFTRLYDNRKRGSAAVSICVPGAKAHVLQKGLPGATVVNGTLPTKNRRCSRTRRAGQEDTCGGLQTYKK